MVLLKTFFKQYGKAERNGYTVDLLKLIGEEIEEIKADKRSEFELVIHIEKTRNRKQIIGFLGAPIGLWVYINTEDSNFSCRIPTSDRVVKDAFLDFNKENIHITNEEEFNIKIEDVQSITYIGIYKNEIEFEGNVGHEFQNYLMEQKSYSF